MKKLIIFLLVVSCSSYNTKHNSKNLSLNFDDNLSFDDFNILLIEYAKISPYPNIDQ
jgi:hypothetical protein